MKLLTLMSVIVVGGSGYLIKVPTLPQPAGPGTQENVDWVQRQKTILSLFDNVCDPSNDVAIIRLAKDFSMDPTDYKNPGVTVNLQNLMSGKGLLPKQQIFSEYNADHLAELQVISEVLCDAREFDIFFRAAAWARQNVNCGVFVDAIYTAIIKRRDTRQLSVPAPYELIPNYFIRKDAIIAGAYLLTGTTLDTANVREDGNAYIITTNYTTDLNEATMDERQMAYFFEDVGLNTYLFLRKLSLVPWMNYLNNVDSTYGEYLYHVMKNLAARCDLERYSNGLEELQAVDVLSGSSTSYNPMLIYSNGEEFGSIEGSIDLSAAASITFLKNVEENIATAVTHMKQNGLNKSQILNNLMEILVVGSKNYEALALRLLSGTKDIKRSPSVLEHYMTAARDPVFWKLNKKIVNIIDNALTYLPTYSRNELYFPGVEVVNVDIKKMVTSFDNFEIDTTDALRAVDSENTFQIKMEQPRLNHKSFSLKVNISSLVAQKGLMKIYLGPKILPGELAVSKNKFMLLDACEISLKKGSNAISRSSDDMSNLSIDFLSLKTLYKNVEDAEYGLGFMPQENVGRLVGFPSRLIVPKGTEEGLPLQVFIFVAPLIKVSVNELGSTNMEFNTATQSPGYPLDLLIENGQLFDLPNVIVKETIVLHKSGPKQSDGDETNPPTTWNGENSFDYASKRGQYAKQTEYLSKQSVNSYSSKPILQKKTPSKLDKKAKKYIPQIKDVILNPIDTMPIIEDNNMQVKDVKQENELEPIIFGKTNNIDKGIQINSGVNKMFNKNFDVMNDDTVKGIDIRKNLDSKLNIYGKKDFDKNIQIKDDGILRSKDFYFNVNDSIENKIDLMGKKDKDIQINAGVDINMSDVNVKKNFDIKNANYAGKPEKIVVNSASDANDKPLVTFLGKKDPTIKISDDGIVKNKDIDYNSSDVSINKPSAGEVNNKLYNKNIEINTDGSLNIKDIVLQPNHTAVGTPGSNFIINKPDKTIQIVDNGAKTTRDIVTHPFDITFDKSLDDSTIVNTQETHLQGKKAYRNVINSVEDRAFPDFINEKSHKLKSIQINSGMNRMINKNFVMTNKNQLNDEDFKQNVQSKLNINGKKDFDKNIGITDDTESNIDLINKRVKDIKINRGVNINKNVDLNVNRNFDTTNAVDVKNRQILKMLGKKDPLIKIADDGVVKTKDVFNTDDINSNEPTADGAKHTLYNKNIEINTDDFPNKKDIVIYPSDGADNNFSIIKPDKTIKIIDDGTEKTRDLVIHPFNVNYENSSADSISLEAQGTVPRLQGNNAYKKFVDPKKKKDTHSFSNNENKLPELYGILDGDRTKENTDIRQKLSTKKRNPTVYDYLFYDYGGYDLDDDQRVEVYE